MALEIWTVLVLLCLSIVVHCSKSKAPKTSSASKKSQVESKLAKLEGSVHQPPLAPLIPKTEAPQKPKVEEVRKKESIVEKVKTEEGKDEKVGAEEKNLMSKESKKVDRKSHDNDTTEQDKASRNGDLVKTECGEKKQTVLNADECDKMDKTLEEGHPAVMENASRLAAAKVIFDPKLVQFGGNLDQLKETKEAIEDRKEMDKELEAACRVDQEKYAARHSKALSALRTKNYKPPPDESEKTKSIRLEKERRVEVTANHCVIYETREVPTDEDENNDELEGNATLK